MWVSFPCSIFHYCGLEFRLSRPDIIQPHSPEKKTEPGRSQSVTVRDVKGTDSRSVETRDAIDTNSFVRRRISVKSWRQVFLKFGSRREQPAIYYFTIDENVSALKGRRWRCTVCHNTFCDFSVNRCKLLKISKQGILCPKLSEKIASMITINRRSKVYSKKFQ